LNIGLQWSFCPSFIYHIHTLLQGKIKCERNFINRYQVSVIICHILFIPSIRWQWKELEVLLEWHFIVCKHLCTDKLCTQRNAKEVREKLQYFWRLILWIILHFPYEKILYKKIHYLKMCFCMVLTLDKQKANPKHAF